MYRAQNKIFDSGRSFGLVSQKSLAQSWLALISGWTSVVYWPTIILSPVVTDTLRCSGSWKEKKFKAYNFDAQGIMPTSGHLHPLMKVRAQFRQIFLEMGYAVIKRNYDNNWHKKSKLFEQYDTDSHWKLCWICVVVDRCNHSFSWIFTFQYKVWFAMFWWIAVIHMLSFFRCSSRFII